VRVAVQEAIDEGRGGRCGWRRPSSIGKARGSSVTVGQNAFERPRSELVDAIVVIGVENAET